MSFEIITSGSSMSSLRAACDPFDNSVNGLNGYSNNTSFGNNNGNGASNTFPFKPLGLPYTPAPRAHMSMTEQAELEFELRYRGNMIVDQQRKIQQLEEELKRSRDQMDMMNAQIAAYEQDRIKDRKKPQSRYWTPDEHQRFLEALNKYGHKDVKAISMFVSTRNATQVRTHAQKYFLRLERERRKKGDEDGSNRAGDDGYGSSGDEFSDNSMSPLEELSPQQSSSGIASPPPLMVTPSAMMTSPPLMTPPPLLNAPLVNPSPLSNASLQNQQPRRRRTTSLITPSLGKSASNHRDAVLAELPTWTPEDYDQFVKGLLAFVDKQEDIGQVSRAICDGYVPHLSVDDVETCYKLVHKLLKQKPAAAQPPAISSPKRRRTSKPELPVNMPVLNDGPLPAMGSMSLTGSGSSSPFASFMSGMPTITGGPLPHPQYGSNMSSAGSLLAFQSSMSSPLMSVNMGMNMRPIMEYGNSMSAMAPLQMNNLGLNSMMGMMDISSVPSSSSQGSQGWAYAFDLPSTSSSLSLPQGAPLVSSLN